MFSENQTVNINGVDNVLVRINNDGYGSEYLKRGSANELRIRVKNSSYTRKGSSTKVNRHSVELTETIFAQTAGDADRVRKAYMVFEDEGGDDTTEFVQFVKSLSVYMTAETRLNQLLNFES